MAERLQRYLARAGVGSRRHAETLITAGRVTVNNQVQTTLGTKVDPGDLVAVDGKAVMPPEHASWYLLYKPAGVVTTLDDPQGRPTVRQLLGAVPTRVFPVGRLDWDAEGALLMTDDGAAAHRLLHPSFRVPRTYLAKVRGVPTTEGLARLVEGVRLEDGPARAVEAASFQPAERNTWLKVTVAEGRPHLVKRLCAAIGHPVLRLYRPYQAGVSVAGMKPGDVRPLRPDELRLVEAVVAGRAIPAPPLSLPPRRHGRAGEDGERRGARPPAPARGGVGRVPRGRPAGAGAAGGRAQAGGRRPPRGGRSLPPGALGRRPEGAGRRREAWQDPRKPGGGESPSKRTPPRGAPRGPGRPRRGGPRGGRRW